MMPNKITAFIAILLISTSALNGCGSSPRERHYVLSTSIDAQSALQNTPTNIGIVIGPITIPEIVNRPQMVVLMADSQVSVAEQSRWAEPLDSGITRVIADNLTQLFPRAQVSSSAQNSTLTADYRVLIDVQHFDSIIGEGVHDEFLWTVRATNKAGITKSGRTIGREAVSNSEYGALVAAHSRALSTLSRDIAAAIHAIP